MNKSAIYTVIVTYNPMKWVERCLGSLLKSKTPTHVIVIDNGSTDNGVSYIRKNYPQVIIIENEKNLGFAKANNIGMRYAIEHGADYIFLLNQDAWVEEDTIGCLVESCNRCKDVGIVSPIHLTGNYSTLDYRFDQYMQSTSYYSDKRSNSVKREYEVEMVNAAAWMIPADVVRALGGFDTLLYRHYDEDDNFVQRVHYHKKKVYVNTSCTICHDREQRTKKDFEDLYNKWNKDIYFMKEVRKLSDINNEFNLFDAYYTYFKGVLSALLFLRKKQFVKCVRVLVKIPKIKKSRTNNIIGNGAWM